MSSVVMYTVGDREHGMGHVMRCLTLAGELRRRGHAVAFATTSQTPGLKRLQAAGYPVQEFSTFDVSWVSAFPETRVAIVDVENGPGRAVLEAARPHFDVLIVTNGSGYTLHERAAVLSGSDFRIYQSPFDEADAQGLWGLPYLILDPAYAACRPAYEGPIVVSLGGSDPHGLTPLVARALAEVKRTKVIVVGGAACAAQGYAENGLEDVTEMNGTRWVYAPPSLREVFDGASLYVGALGMSAYEAAAAGVPAILTAWSREHERTARELEARGTAVSAGLWDRVSERLIHDLAEIVLLDRAGWQAMSAAGKALVDGQGAARVAARLELMLSLVEVWA